MAHSRYKKPAQLVKILLNDQICPQSLHHHTGVVVAVTALWEKARAAGPYWRAALSRTSCKVAAPAHATKLPVPEFKEPLCARTAVRHVKLLLFKQALNVVWKSERIHLACVHKSMLGARARTIFKATASAIQVI